MRGWTRAGVGGLTAMIALGMTGADPALAVAGRLDPSFSGDGIATANFTPNADFVWDVAIQADGKIVAAGGSNDGRAFALARFGVGGALDPMFGGGDGRVVTPITSGADIIDALAIQADQKIVVAGQVGGSGGRYGLARYLSDGTLDTSFGGDGIVTTNLTTSWDHAWGLAIQPDEKIVAVGASGFRGGAFSALRYNPDGTLDSTFSDDGKVITNFTAGDDWAWDVALQPDGKIVVSGVAGRSRSDKRIALVRYEANGSLDTTFSADGRVLKNLTPGWDDASGVSIQADGKIVTAGAVGGAGGQLLVSRFDTNGALDTTFSGNGDVRTNFSLRDDFAWEIALQPDGKIVAAGTAGIGRAAGVFAIARYGATGSLDPTFGGDGKVVTNVTRGVDVATAVTIQADGAIVVGGTVGGGGRRFAVARYFGA
jgi:uncharacterized delta-60 repeat protein